MRRVAGSGRSDEREEQRTAGNIRRKLIERDPPKSEWGGEQNIIIIRKTVHVDHWSLEGEGKDKEPHVVTCVGCPDMVTQGVESICKKCAEGAEGKNPLGRRRRAGCRGTKTFP